MAYNRVRCPANAGGGLAAAALLLAASALLSPCCRAATQPAPGAPLADGAGAQSGALRMGLTPSTQIVYRPRPWQAAGPQLENTAPPRESLGLEFRATKPGRVANNLFRVELSGDSMLQFRPRGGGLTVNYGARF
jgi:hypothetical protein